MNRFVISLGSNTYDRQEKMAAAIAHFCSALKVEARSSVYETEPWGGGDKTYANCVMAGSTSLTEDALSSLAKSWERECGRDEYAKSAGIVPIDVDIVIWNDVVLRSKELERDYFLKGYKEIFPEGWVYECE